MNDSKEINDGFKNGFKNSKKHNIKVSKNRNNSKNHNNNKVPGLKLAPTFEVSTPLLFI